MTEDQVFQQLDAEKIKEEAVKAAQKTLIDRLQGNKPQFSWEEKGKKAPDTYHELFDEVKKQIPVIDEATLEKKLEEKLAEREKKEQERLFEEKKKTVETLQEKAKRFDTDWYDLMQKGKMPRVAEPLQEKINKGELLSKEEINNDPGLKARLDLIQLTQATGKTVKEAFYEDFEPTYSGAAAPVFGGRTAAPTQRDKEESYEELHAEAVRMGLTR